MTFCFWKKIFTKGGTETDEKDNENIGLCDDRPVCAVLGSICNGEQGRAEVVACGKIKGKRTKEAVITLKLVRKGDPVSNYVDVTSTNRYNDYAFSRPDGGLPRSAYKIVVFVGKDQVTEISLDKVKKGGRVPTITLNW